MRYMLNFALLAFSFFVLSLNPIEAAPSFNCDKAQTKVEKSICSSDELSDLDAKMAIEYKKFFNLLSENRKPQAKAMQRLWLKGRDFGCEYGYLDYCIRESYRVWLEAIERNVLLAVVPILPDSALLISPFDKSITYALSDVTNSEEIPEEDKDINPRKYVFHAYLDKTPHLLHEGNEIRTGNWIEIDNVTHLRFYLTQFGSMHTAYQSLDEYTGGRCGSNVYKYINFIQTNHQFKAFAKVKLLDASYLCGTFELGLHDWQASATGDLQFYGLDTAEFYYQVNFTELNLIEIDSINGRMSKIVPFIDNAESSFLGQSYDQLIKTLGESINSQNESFVMRNSGFVEKMRDVCGSSEFPIMGLSSYYQLKDSLRGNALGFNQIKYFAFHLLKPEQLKEAKRYRLYLEAALMYLEKVQEYQNWEVKLRKAASEYPSVNVNSNYFFSKEVDWIENPFLKAGFYTDEKCFSQLSSPFHMASAEEWFYLFWARRVQDGNLESAKSILQLVINYMNEID